MYGPLFFLTSMQWRGDYLLPNKAKHFTKCDQAQNQCPAHSSCKFARSSDQAATGNYCRCEDDFLNPKEKLTFTDLDGECLEKCQSQGNPVPCACRPSFITKLNENGLYSCINKCTNDSDCPSGASCRRGDCYCTDGCSAPRITVCIPLVNLDGACEGSTTRPPLTTNVNTRYTTVDPTPGSSTPQPGTTTSLSTTVSLRYTTEITQSASPTSQPVQDRCEANSKSMHESEECERHDNTDLVCTFLKSIVNITELSCDRNTNTSTQIVANKITKLLNETSLKKFPLPHLQTVVLAVIENVETSLLASFSSDPHDQQINTPEIDAEMMVSHNHCGKDRESLSLTVNNNKMEVPCSLVNFMGGGAMLISYKGITDRLNGNILAAFGNSNNGSTEEVISQLIGGAITRPDTEKLDPPVTFTLKHLTAVKEFYDPQCVYWDTQEAVWSTRGCETQRSEQKNSTDCVCTHLSTFAIIMAPTEIQEDSVLTLISLIGLSISLVCLFLSLLTFILCRSLRSAHTSILAVLCGCLFLGQLLVLVGLRQTWNKILCSVIAGSLQFLFLCAFCWMSLESILLFLTVRNLQAVNYMNAQRSYFPYVCLIGFGVPSIIMIVSASAYPHIYGEKKHCWLKSSHVWSFLGPVCLFILVNFTLLVLTFWLLKKKLASLNTNVSTLKHNRLLTFKALSQLLILGCTWIIGLFQFGPGSYVASYIFTICNSLQGLYIFIVHCLLNRQVQEEYRRVFRRVISMKSISDTETGSTVPMTLKHSRLSEATKEDTLCSKQNKTS
ncbi:hypothetical protein GDO81_009169 [Engystomops pustulosus]|uniref:Uncharacterized protein n=1 Tax=Engystomops pustulosus TaxID=76066 RepID=A0AAV7BPS4_ENGPU|nr:hypothetical protein GDO81_009169 [Engystomops pustulosus]